MVSETVCCVVRVCPLWCFNCYFEQETLFTSTQLFKWGPSGLVSTGEIAHPTIGTWHKLVWVPTPSSLAWCAQPRLYGTNHPQMDILVVSEKCTGTSGFTGLLKTMNDEVELLNTKV